jgi:hypothetical protein
MPFEGGEEILVLEDVYSSGWAMADEGVYLFRETKPHPSIQFFTFATEEVTPIREVREDLCDFCAQWMSVAPGGDWLLYTVGGRRGHHGAGKLPLTRFEQLLRKLNLPEEVIQRHLALPSP